MAYYIGPWTSRGEKEDSSDDEWSNANQKSNKYQSVWLETSTKKFVFKLFLKLLKILSA